MSEKPTYEEILRRAYAEWEDWAAYIREVGISYLRFGAQYSQSRDGIETEYKAWRLMSSVLARTFKEDAWMASGYLTQDMDTWFSWWRGNAKVKPEGRNAGYLEREPQVRVREVVSG